MLPTGQFIVGVLPHSGPQDGQCEAGKTMDFLSGSRIMHTFRKLPTTAPTTKRKAGISQFVMKHNLFYRNEWL
jgi:hypothetical protein